jgi:hypothetical protein
MATVQLWINSPGEVIGELPKVCMQCGAPATTVRIKRFVWTPHLNMFKRYQRVEAPFCAQHENHWLFRRRLIGAVSIILFLCGLVGMIATGASRNSIPDDTDLVMFLVGLGWSAVWLAWIAFAYFYHRSAIRVERITDQEITLTNVSPAFVVALYELGQELERNMMRDVNERWRDRRDSDSHPDARIEGAERLPPKPSPNITDDPT